MKYEMIFGDEKLFDGAPEYATHATNGGGFYGVNDGMVEYISDGIFNGMKISSVSGSLIAERRIIKEPKRWTQDDKDAGKLPDVGAIVITKQHEGHAFEGEFVCEMTGNYWCIKIGDKGFSVNKKHIHTIEKPIETPEERAQRLKSEWCAKAAKQLKNLEYTSTLTSIYEALLSGELKAPEVSK